MALYTKVSGTWRDVRYPMLKVSNTWRNLIGVYIKTSGTWRNMWTYAWYTSSYGSCNVSCGGGTQTRTVTCRRSDGIDNVGGNVPCNEVSSKPATSTSCNTHSCAPSYTYSLRCNPTPSYINCYCRYSTQYDPSPNVCYRSDGVQVSTSYCSGTLTCTVNCGSGPNMCYWLQKTSPTRCMGCWRDTTGGTGLSGSWTARSYCTNGSNPDTSYGATPGGVSINNPLCP